MKKILLLVLAFGSLVSQTVKAQFNLTWDATFAHTTALNYSNESRKMVTDDDGNIFVLADVTSDIDPAGNIASGTFHYTVVMKYDANGSFIKKVDINVNNHLISGQNNLGAFGLELDASGNVYIGYNFIDPNSGSDVWAAKFDNNLVGLWAMKYNPMSADYGVDMKIDVSGNAFIVVKSVNGAVTQYHILKTDLMASVLQSVEAFDPNEDFINQMALDFNQNVYVTGYRFVSGSKTVMTASITNAGVLRWKSIYNGGSVIRDDFGTGITFGVDGWLYVTGTSDQGSPNLNDFLTIQYYPGNGKKTWITFHNYGVNDNGIFVRNLDPNFIYVGSVSGNNTVLLTRIKTIDGVLSGNFVYHPEPARPFTTINSLNLADFEVSTNNNFYVTGQINATDTTGQPFSAAYFTKFKKLNTSRNAFRIDIEEPAPGEFDESYEGTGIALNYFNDNVVWMRNKIFDYSMHYRETIELFSYTQPNPIRIQGVSAGLTTVELFPNPAHDEISITSNETLEKVEITAMDGKLIKTITANSSYLTSNISELPAGIYIIQVYTSQGALSHHRMVKN